MTEIRNIHAEEGEAFLQLLCEVFQLDFNRAYDVFFAEPLFDLSRKWALFEGREMVSILTTTPLEFGWGRAFGIAGVATQKGRQREGHASRLLQRVLREGERRGEPSALLFARDTSVYDRNGFEPLDRVIRAPLKVRPEEDAPTLDDVDVESRYAAWAQAHPDRLRRDARRWEYWRWNYRVTTEFGSGYLCHEPGVLREAVYSTPVDALPLPLETDWLGTTLVADQLEIPVVDPVVDLYLMGHNVPGVPQLFMTDQF